MPVADIEEWPNNSWTLIKSHPSLSKWVAKECLSICGKIFLFKEVCLIMSSKIYLIPREVKVLPLLFKNKYSTLFLFSFL